jgi:hypothetical protein
MTDWSIYVAIVKKDAFSRPLLDEPIKKTAELIRCTHARSIIAEDK